MAKRILFCSQDPGSANALAPVIKGLKKSKETSVVVFARNHSCDIFAKKEIPHINLNGQLFETDFSPKTIDLIILGASAGRNSIEKEAIGFAKWHGITTISILDFWSNYALRFSKEKGDLTCLPDYIFVMDEIAKQRMIEENIPKERIIITGNPFFDTFQKRTTEDKSDNIKGILYISQPLVKNGKYISDLETIKSCIESIKQVNRQIKLTIRPHPKEEESTYLQLTQDPMIHITIDSKSSIKDLLNRYQIILGKHSMVLFQAVCQGKTVISYQPAKEKHDRLITNDLGLSFRANNLEELKTLLKKAIQNSLPTRDMQRVAKYLNGKNTSRVLEQLNKVMNSTNSS